MYSIPNMPRVCPHFLSYVPLCPFHHLASFNPVEPWWLWNERWNIMFDSKGEIHFRTTSQDSPILITFSVYHFRDAVSLCWFIYTTLLPFIIPSTGTCDLWQSSHRRKNREHRQPLKETIKKSCFLRSCEETDLSSIQKISPIHCLVHSRPWSNLEFATSCCSIFIKFMLITNKYPL